MLSLDVAAGVAQTVLVALQAAWLTLGACDNLRFPEINRGDVRTVLRLGALDEYPEIRRYIAHRAIESERVVALLFAVAVGAESVTALALWVSTGLLAAALLGFGDPVLARGVALLCVLAFTSIWGAFLVGGQWFYYWYGSFGQQTHFLMLLWGIGTALVLIAGGGPAPG